MKKIKSVVKKVVSKALTPLRRHNAALKARDNAWKAHGQKLKSGATKYRY